MSTEMDCGIIPHAKSGKNTFPAERKTPDSIIALALW